MALVKAAIKAMETERREERRNRGRAHDEYWCDSQRRAKELLGCDKSLTDDALADLTESNRYEAAKQCARRMEARHEGDGSSPGANPSSSMHLLIESVRRSSGE